MFNFVSVPIDLSRTFYSVLNCCAVLRHLAKIEVLHICCRGLQTTGAVTELGRNAAAAGGSTHID